MSNLKSEDFNKDPLQHIKKFKPVEAKKSKDEVWAELETMLEKPVKKKVFFYNPRVWQIAASAFIIFLLTNFLGVRFYTKTVTSLPGKQELAVLPDGSEVYLNANTEISYQPLWWSFNREVKLNGEAFFKVKRGEKFTVVSEKGETSVVGTSFNIFARDVDYIVTCLTGKVKVLSPQTNEETLIKPNQMVSISKSGNIQLNLNVDAKLATDWTTGKFIFTQVPINDVLSEIARRYGVQINNLTNVNELYTGSFNKESDIELVLNLVCKPFELEYKKLPSGAYAIQQTK